VAIEDDHLVVAFQLPLSSGEFAWAREVGVIDGGVQEVDRRAPVGSWRTPLLFPEPRGPRRKNDCFGGHRRRAIYPDAMSSSSCAAK
jgi:hypothetical protein